MTTIGMVTINEAMRIAGLTRRTFARRLAAGEVRVLVDGRDRRRRLVPVEDLVTLVAPKPVAIVQRNEAPPDRAA